MAAVLVVEDEPIVRMDAAMTLEDEGFEVIEAATARSALAMLEKRHGEVVALFTDVDMPGDMDGLELAGIVTIVGPTSRSWSRLVWFACQRPCRMAACSCQSPTAQQPRFASSGTSSKAAVQRRRRLRHPARWIQRFDHPGYGRAHHLSSGMKRYLVWRRVAPAFPQPNGCGSATRSRSCYT
jgi:hypothetical protein